MKVSICGLTEVNKLVKEGNFTHIISIGLHDSGCYGGSKEKIPFQFRNVPNRLRLEFDDVMFDDNPSAPTQEDVQRAIDFISQIPPDGNLLVHCYAGISRSGAIGLIALFMQTGNIYEADKELMKIRPQASPNLLVLHYADVILGTGDTLVGCGEVIDARHHIHNSSLWG